VLATTQAKEEIKTRDKQRDRRGFI